MEKLRSVENIPKANGKEAVACRLDLDVPKSDDKRLKNSIPSIKYLLQEGYTPIVLGHKKRPKGIGYEEEFSLYPVYLRFKKILEKELGREINSTFINDITDEIKVKDAIDQYEIIFTDNIRFYQGEKKGDASHLNILKKYCRYFVYDAIAVAHRTEGSVVFHREMETYYGFNFVEEYQAMEILNKRTGKLVIFGGSKEDKLDNLIKIAEESNAVFIGGRLPLFRQKIEGKLGKIPKNVFWADLSEDGYDLSDDDISKLKTLITFHPTIVWTGALGWFEEGYVNGTAKIATAIIKSNAYVAIGGGDTAASIIDLGGKDKIDFLCSAGGAFLYALAFGPENLSAII